jgi:hypothetical protein
MFLRAGFPKATSAVADPRFSLAIDNPMHRTRSSQKASLWVTHFCAERELAPCAAQEFTGYGDVLQIERHRTAVLHLQATRHIGWCHEHTEGSKGVINGGSHHPSLHGTIRIPKTTQNGKARGQSTPVPIKIDELSLHDLKDRRRDKEFIPPIP